jgi:flagellar basal body-associated protein FliL
MPSPDQAGQNNRGVHRPRIITILIVQIAVLLALSGAVIFYLDWSSEAAQAEFMRAIESASGPSHLPQPPTAIHPVKSRTTCIRKV